MEVLQATARTLVEWMLYCLIEGTALALFAWLLLHLLPRQNAGTRFAVWFSVLLAVTALPFVAGPGSAGLRTASQNGNGGVGLITLPGSWAVMIFAVWAFFASLALARVVDGIRQIGTLRRNSKAIDPSALGPQIQAMIAGFSRPVALRASSTVQVPTAIGFFKPTIVLPGWFVEEISREELRQVLLHELTHLRRRDDWTNLAQKIVKALLFFNPPVLWIEQRLSSEREMACDEAVLAQAVGPEDYANCLRHVAEKSFLRRQMALAQTMINRMRQLSFRVTQILDAERPRSTRLWRPAVPIVVVAATVCGVGVWNAPPIVGFRNDGPVVASALPSGPAAPAVATAGASEVNTNFRFNTTAMNPARPKRPTPVSKTAGMVNAARRFRTNAPKAQAVIARQINFKGALPAGDYVVSEQVFVTMTRSQQNWQVQVWQVRVLLPARNAPSKTVTRKNI